MSSPSSAKPAAALSADPTCFKDLTVISCDGKSRKHLYLHPLYLAFNILSLDTGRQDIHLAGFTCTQCSSVTYQSASLLASVGLYPGSFDDLARNKTYVHALVLEEHAARKLHNPGGGTAGFIKELNVRSMSHGSVRFVVILLGNAFTESNDFCQCADEAYQAGDIHQCLQAVQYYLDRLRRYCKEECPPCSIEQVYGAVDGLMKLYVYERPKRAVGTSFYEKKQGAIFVPDR